MPTLLCTIGGVLVTADAETAIRRLNWLSRRPLNVQTASQLEDDALLAFRTGTLTGEQYVEHLRATIGWEGSDDELVEIIGDVWSGVDLGVLDLLAALRQNGWHIVGVDDDHLWGAEARNRRFPSLTDAFDQMLTTRVAGVLMPDARFFAFAKRCLPPEVGPVTTLT